MKMSFEIGGENPVWLSIGGTPQNNISREVKEQSSDHQSHLLCNTAYSKISISIVE